MNVIDKKIYLMGAETEIMLIGIKAPTIHFAQGI